jgi:hypothetical protein
MKDIKSIVELLRGWLLTMPANHKLDIESGYGVFRAPAIDTAEDRAALAQQVETILAQQQSDGWWAGECDGTATISSSSFTRNAIKLSSYLQTDRVIHQSLGSNRSKKEM